ncbi:MAG: hypothetical protein WC047_00440 [Kiritimatiellales bacterium]
MESKLYWMEISPDGLLKDPEDAGPHYSTESFNGYGGFDTEEEAISRLEYMKKAYQWDVPSRLTLIRIF